MPHNIINFNSDRPGSKSTPVGVSLPLFDITEIGHTTASLDVLYVSNIIITSTGSGYTSAPSVVLTVITGSVISSASLGVAVSSNKVTGVSINGSGRFGTNTRLSASLSGGGGTGATVYIALSKSKKINSFLTKQPLYSEYLAAKEKLKLVLYTKKGEVVRNSLLGTRIYEFLFSFPNVDEIVLNGELTGRFTNILKEDIEEQVPELEILSIVINKQLSDISKNKIAIHLVTRHRNSNRVFSLDLSSFNGILKEYYINENLNQKEIQYLT